MNDQQERGPDSREQTVLQDGKAIQIDTMEKKRLDRQTI